MTDHIRPLGVPGPHAPASSVTRQVTAGRGEALLVVLCRDTLRDPTRERHCGRVVRVHLVPALPHEDGRRELVSETQCPTCWRRWMEREDAA